VEDGLLPVPIAEQMQLDPDGYAHPFPVYIRILHPDPEINNLWGGCCANCERPDHALQCNIRNGQPEADRLPAVLGAGQPGDNGGLLATGSLENPVLINEDDYDDSSIEETEVINLDRLRTYFSYVCLGNCGSATLVEALARRVSNR
jgi:hypothetical protein